MILSSSLRELSRRTAHRLASMARDRSGVAAVEMALVTPFLVLLICGGAETASLLSANYKAAQMATTVSDAVARYNTISGGAIAGIFGASADVMGDKGFSSKGYVILTSVTRGGKASDTPKVAWQCAGGGTMVKPSRVGAMNNNAALPGNLVLDTNDNVIVSEVFYQYTPMFSLLPITDPLYYKTAIFRPRLGALSTPPSC